VGELCCLTVGIKNVERRRSGDHRKTVAGLYGCPSHASIVGVTT
jgi:hypothetical protein